MSSPMSTPEGPTNTVEQGISAVGLSPPREGDTKTPKVKSPPAPAAATTKAGSLSPPAEVGPSPGSRSLRSLTDSDSGSPLTTPPHDISSGHEPSPSPPPAQEGSPQVPPIGELLHQHTDLPLVPDLDPAYNPNADAEADVSLYYAPPAQVPSEDPFNPALLTATAEAIPQRQELQHDHEQVAQQGEIGEPAPPPMWPLQTTFSTVDSGPNSSQDSSPSLGIYNNQLHKVYQADDGFNSDSRVSSMTDLSLTNFGATKGFSTENSSESEYEPGPVAYGEEEGGGVPAPKGTGKVKKSHARRQPEGHIKRARNAFILFRKHITDSGLIPTSVEVKHQNISVVAAKMWREAPQETRAHFQEMARIEKEEHQRKYPGYRYQPIFRRTDIIRRRVRRDAAEDDKVEVMAEALIKGKAGKQLEEEVKKELGGVPGSSGDSDESASKSRSRRRRDVGELSKGAIRAQRAQQRAKAMRQNLLGSSLLGGMMYHGNAPPHHGAYPHHQLHQGYPSPGEIPHHPGAAHHMGYAAHPYAGNGASHGHGHGQGLGVEYMPLGYDVDGRPVMAYAHPGAGAMYDPDPGMIYRLPSMRDSDANGAHGAYETHLRMGTGQVPALGPGPGPGPAPTLAGGPPGSIPGAVPGWEGAVPQHHPQEIDYWGSRAMAHEHDHPAQHNEMQMQAQAEAHAQVQLQYTQVQLDEAGYPIPLRREDYIPATEMGYDTSTHRQDYPFDPHPHAAAAGNGLYSPGVLEYGLPPLAEVSQEGLPSINMMNVDAESRSRSRTRRISDWREEQQTTPSGHVLFDERLFDGALGSAGLGVAGRRELDEGLGAFDEAVEQANEGLTQW